MRFHDGQPLDAAAVRFSFERAKAPNSGNKSRSKLFDNIERIVKVVGFVASTPDFTGQPAVINGASNLLGEIFGENGEHARAAVGVAALPNGAPVEVTLDVVVRD